MTPEYLSVLHTTSVAVTLSVSILSLLCSFFLEKNMQQFFLKTLSQKCGRFVCLQLLQTLSILFENIRNETSICELTSKKTTYRMARVCCVCLH